MAADRPGPAAAAVAGLAVLVVLPVPAAVALAGVAVALVRAVAVVRRRREEQAIAAAIPELVDQLLLAAAAGLPVRAALEVVAPRAPPAVRPVLVAVVRRIGHGTRLAEALGAAAPQLGPVGEPVVQALLDGAASGQPLVPVLARLAADAHHQARRAGEERARRLPVLLLFPLALCVLPAAVLLAVVPVLVASLDRLHP